MGINIFTINYKYNILIDKYILQNKNYIVNLLYKKNKLKNKNVPFSLLKTIYINYINNDIKLKFL